MDPALVILIVLGTLVCGCALLRPDRDDGDPGDYTGYGWDDGGDGDGD